jgi:hypothetical protein
MRLALWKLVLHELVETADIMEEDAENTNLNFRQKSPERVVFCFIYDIFGSKEEVYISFSVLLLSV